jgi:hemerythrin
VSNLGLLLGMTAHAAILVRGRSRRPSKHRAEHRLFVMTLTRLQAQEAPTADDAFCLARDWILEHILGMDRQHSTWMLPRSITPP